MNFKVPSLLYTIRIVIFASLLSCLIWMSNIVSGVVFLIAVAFNICDFVVTSKYGSYKCGKINKFVFMLFDRLIVLLPLIFAVVGKKMAVWVLLILVVFEFAIAMYKYYDETKGINKRVLNTIYVAYNLILYTSCILFLYNIMNVATYFVFASSIVGAGYIVYSSVNFVGEDGSFEEEVKPSEVNGDDVIKSVTSSQDEIVE